jgi:hypothetical protein
MFIESSRPLIPESPFMGERRLVALLKELISLNWACLFYKHFTATRFFRQTPPRARSIILHLIPGAYAPRFMLSRAPRAFGRPN